MVIAAFDQALEDLLSAVRVFFQPGADRCFVWIDFAGASFVTPSFVAIAGQPFGNRPAIERHLLCDLMDTQRLLLSQEVHFGVLGKADHDLPPPMISPSASARRRPLMCRS